MAPSLLYFRYRRAIFFLTAFVLRTLAITHNYDWTVGWVNANPDGMLERPVIGLNGQWPWPLLNFTLGDRVIVNLHNGVGTSSRATIDTVS